MKDAFRRANFSRNVVNDTLSFPFSMKLRGALVVDTDNATNVPILFVDYNGQV